MKRVLAVVSILAFIPACSGSARDSASKSGGKASASSNAVATASSASRRVTQASAEPGSTGSPTSATAAPGEPQGPNNHCFKPVTTSRNNIRMDVSIEPKTASKATPVRVSVITEPDVLIGISFEFIDHQPHGGYAPPTRSRPDGSWDWAWTIPPDVPSGPARVMIAGGKSGGSGAAGEAQFTVAGDWNKTCEP